jgi:predicted DNA-binding transcriptional regulator AlpA
MQSANAPLGLIPRIEVERLAGSPSTLKRWLAKYADFPRPFVVERRWFFRAAEVADWFERRRAA